MKKKLSELTEAVRLTEKNGINQNDPDICGLAYDSRAVKKGFLFFALPGTHAHGNEYIVQAAEKGAAAVLYQDEPDQNVLKKAAEKGAVLLKTINTRTAMAPVAQAFYGSPSQKIGVIGVTGTEGKSTTVSLVWQLLRLAGKKAGFISTVEYSFGGEALENPEHQTTPEAPVIQEKLFSMLQNGCEYAVIESSSHGLSEKTNRLGGVLFDAAAFMNVTHEHLEFHGTREQYKSDKANLFRALGAHSRIKYINGKKTHVPAIGAVNLDDEAAEYFAGCAECETIGFTMHGCGRIPERIKTVFSAVDLKSSEHDLLFTLEEYENSAGEVRLTGCVPIQLNLPGAFNAYNVMAALALVSGLLNCSVKELAPLTANLKPVKGRMTAVSKGQPFEVIVDYAHTPSSFEMIFPPLKKRAKGKIISVFGSGGERDVQKRPAQGKIAAEYSDTVILTDEDPRGEDSMELLEMIAAGCPDLKRGEELFLIPDRQKAIRKAFSLAKKDDMVLLLGKGHENSIIFKTHTMKYDEISEAEKALAEMGYA